jgi:hypothetical protein
MLYDYLNCMLLLCNRVLRTFTFVAAQTMPGKITPGRGKNVISYYCILSVV